jgi:hypothetical protein
MIKVRPSQVFDFETEEHVAEDGQRTSDPSPPPTLDERANLYLNAVYGAREFKGEEYAYARRIILDAMTIDVGVGLEDIVEDVPAHENSAPSERHRAALPSFSAFDTTSQADAYSARRLPRAQAFEPSFSDFATTSRANAYSARPLSRAQAFDRDLERELVFAAADLRRNLPRHKARRRSFVLFAAIAGCLVFAAITIVTLPLVLPSMRTESNSIALSPGEIKTLLSSGNSLEVVETTAASRLASSELGGRLFGLGNKLVAGGDMYGGRLILQEAANEGMASAALALGATFDPIEAKALGHPDSSPDLEKARLWYLRAKLLGSTEAQARLDRLPK